MVINFVVTFGDGSTWVATSTVTPASSTSISGTANITSGTGTFLGAHGSFSFVTPGLHVGQFRVYNYRRGDPFYINRNQGGAWRLERIIRAPTLPPRRPELRNSISGTHRAAATWLRHDCHQSNCISRLRRGPAR